MGNPYLNRDESIILTTLNVRFGPVVTELILTSQRLILFDSRHAQFRFQTIPLSTIETVIPGEDTQGNPVISLSISALQPDSAPQSKELIFSQTTGEERTQERDKWVQQLREQIAAVRKEALLSTRPPAQMAPDIIFEEPKAPGADRVPAESVPGGTSPVFPDSVFPPDDRVSEADTGTTEGLPAMTTPLPESEGATAQDDTEPPAEKSPLPSRAQPPPASSHKPVLIAVTAIIIAVIAIAVGLIYVPGLQAPPTESIEPVISPTITPAATLVPTPSTLQQTPTPLVTAKPASQPTVLIPDRGVWVKVHYAGNFSGRVGTSGDIKLVNASGVQYYQLPVTEGIVEATIQKQDGSGNVLTVEVYNNGRMLARSTKATPFGTIDMRVDLKGV